MIDIYNNKNRKIIQDISYKRKKKKKKIMVILLWDNTSFTSSA